MSAQVSEMPHRIVDFSAHNAEVRAVWDAYHRGKPIRVPMILGINPRYLLCETGANALHVDFRTYSEDPDTMFEAQLRFQYWIRHHLMQDADMGIPEQWHVYVDFQNYYESAWFGCPIEYRDGQVPDVRPVFAAEPDRLLSQGAPRPFGGVMGRALEFHARMSDLASERTFYGKPVVANAPSTGLGTDGPFTIACNVLSCDTVCEMMAAEPRRLGRLLDFITDATIERVAAWKDRFRLAYPHDGYGIADDSISLISTAAYREHILPRHRRLFEAFATERGRSIHLCGNAARHFPTIRDELGVMSFDTGFPVDFGRLRAELGPDVQLYGGPSAPFLVEASSDEVRSATLDILRSGVTQGGKFVMREGNNLAPGTPAVNIAAMYEVVREFGYYDARGPQCIQ